MDFQGLVDAMGNAARGSRSQYHLTLGKLIEKLEFADPKARVYFSNDGKSPGLPMSYRGYYSDLAFPASPDEIYASQFLGICKAALNETFVGYKGGDFVMDARTPLWRAEYGHSGNEIISDARATDQGFELVVKTIED